MGENINIRKRARHQNHTSNSIKEDLTAEPNVTIWTPTSFLDGLKHLFREAFLPQGYPDSVSADYGQYQLYDTVQAFCSRVTGTIATKAVLKGVGVGDAQATPLAAAIAWVFKDGTGMIGSIVFAWWKGGDFDADCKKWRLLADVLNDAAMLIELLAGGNILLLCLATAARACVGVAGGATRSAVTYHQALKGNVADVAAKDASQETLVNLCASLVGVLVLAFSWSESVDWLMFLLFTCIHIWANYRAVKALQFNTFNTERYNLVLAAYLFNKVVLGPVEANAEESVILGCGLRDEDLCDRRITLDISTNKTPLSVINDSYCVNKATDCTIEVTVSSEISSEELLQAYFHAVIISIAASTQKSKENKRAEHELLSKYRTLSNDKSNVIRDFVDTEFKRFLRQLQKNGWQTEHNRLRYNKKHGV